MTQTLIRIDPASPVAARRLRANRAALSAIAPEALSKIAAPSEVPRELFGDVADPDTVVNVSMAEGFLYSDDPRVLADQQASALAQSRQSYIPAVVSYSAEDGIAYPRILELDKAFGAPLMAEPKPYGVSKRYAPILTVFGIGLGWHIDALLEQFDVQHLILCESDIDLFRASLQAIDWQPIAACFKASGKGLKLIVEADPRVATNNLLAALQTLSPALIVGSRYFRLYPSPAMDFIAEQISQRLPLLSYGWGYFKDERRQVLQTATNVRTPRPWLKRIWPSLEGADAVVVGAGPSLEKTLPLLRQVRERVVLFTGGSAIRPLARAGIEPDYHIELETSPVTATVLKELEGSAFFDRVPLIASNGMDPETLDLFRKVFLFVRESSVSSSLFADLAEQVPGCYPVVGNAAVGVAAALGFRRITTFGVDFGYRDPRHHHALGTIYMDDVSKAAHADLASIGIENVTLSDFTDTRHRLVSIPGDPLLSDNVFYVSHVAMEIFLNRMPDVTLIQCGDGARVGGAVNLAPDQFDPATYRGSRASMMDLVRERFEPAPIDGIEYARRMSVLADTIAKTFERLREVLVRRRLSATDYAHLASEMHDLLRSTTRRMPAAKELLDGIFTSYFKATIERSFMASSADEQVRFIRLAQEHFLLLLDDLLMAMEPLRAPATTAGF